MHSPITRRLSPVAAILIVQLGLTMVAAPAQADASSTTKLESDIVALTNRQRTLHGCDAVRVDPRLSQASAAHSAYMARTGAFSHTDALGRDFMYRAKAADYPRPLAENIAVGFRTGTDVINAWMKSPMHRANLLNCQATAVGVGAIFVDGGTAYVTQDFGD